MTAGILAKFQYSMLLLAQVRKYMTCTRTTVSIPRVGAPVYQFPTCTFLYKFDISAEARTRSKTRDNFCE